VFDENAASSQHLGNFFEQVEVVEEAIECSVGRVPALPGVELGALRAAA